MSDENVFQIEFECSFVLIVGYTKRTMDHCEMRQRGLKRNETISQSQGGKRTKSKCTNDDNRTV